MKRPTSILWDSEEQWLNQEQLRLRVFFEIFFGRLKRLWVGLLSRPSTHSLDLSDKVLDLTIL
jgi:hypothetical protein